MIDKCTMPNNCVTLAYSPAADPTVYEYMKSIAVSSQLTIAPFNNITASGYDIVGYDNCYVLSNAVQTNWRAFSEGICWLVPTGTYTLVSRDSVYDAFLGRSYDFLSRRLRTQVVVEATIMSMISNQSATLDIEFSQIQDRSSFSAVGATFSLMFGGTVIYFGFFTHVIVTTNVINHDRNHKFRQGLNIMGLNPGPYWTSWFITQAVFAFFSSIVSIAIGHLCQISFIMQTNIFVLFLVFWICSLNIIAFGLTLASFFHKTAANIAIMIVSLVFSVTMVFFSATSNTLSLIWDTDLKCAIFGIFYQFHFGKIMLNIILKSAGPNASQNGGYTFDNLFDPPLPMYCSSAPSDFGSLIIMLVLGILGLFLAWYLDCISPGEQGGIPKRLYFIFDPYWWGILVNSQSAVPIEVHSTKDMNSVLTALDIDIQREHDYVMKQTLSRDPNTLLKVIKLSKTFSGKTQDARALDSLTLAGEKGTILAVLGHNGAGKTTCINMITGLFPPTFGDCWINNLSIKHDMDRIRKQIGVCPQHDILWPELTAIQHLEIACAIKGVPPDSIKSVIASSLDQVKLTEWGKFRVSTYSGGMKRRLSVAIASVGKPCIIFLDEPTTGLDPSNKLEIWRLIENLKKDKLVVLTTHSMEEADALADKIAVLAIGQLRAVGNSLHLKHRYGAGYHIHIVAKKGKTENVKASITTLLPDAQLNVDVSGDLNYSLPASRLDLLQKFLNFLEKVAPKDATEDDKDDRKSNGMIQDWGISQTTLEEVFIRITHGDQHTFKDNTDQGTSPAYQQLEVSYVDTPTSPIGFVSVTPSTTLQSVRMAIMNFSTHPSTPFQFISSGNIIPNEKEDTLLAFNFLPLISIQQQALPQTNISEMDYLRKELANAHSELKSLQKKYEESHHKEKELQDKLLQQQDLIRQLQQEIATLKQS